LNYGDSAPFSFPHLPRLPDFHGFSGLLGNPARSGSLPTGRTDADIGSAAMQVEPCVQSTHSDSRANMAKSALSP
jgi:hypothetical protein